MYSVWEDEILLYESNDLEDLLGYYLDSYAINNKNIQLVIKNNKNNVVSDTEIVKQVFYDKYQQEKIQTIKRHYDNAKSIRNELCV